MAAAVEEGGSKGDLLCFRALRRGLASLFATVWAYSALTTAAVVDAFDELQEQSKHSVPVRLYLTIEDIAKFSRAKFQEVAKAQRRDNASYGMSGKRWRRGHRRRRSADSSSNRPFPKINGASAVILSYKKKRSRLTNRTNRRIRKMMHYNVDLSPFQVTVELVGPQRPQPSRSPVKSVELLQGQSQRPSPSPVKPDENNQIESLASQAANVLAAAVKKATDVKNGSLVPFRVPAVSPPLVQHTPLSFPPSPRARRKILSDFSSFTDELLTAAGEKLEAAERKKILAKRERALLLPIVEQAAEHKEPSDLENTTGFPARIPRTETRANLSLVIASEPDKVLEVDGDSAGLSDHHQVHGQPHRRVSTQLQPHKIRPPSFGMGAEFCHPQIHLSCRNYLATKASGSLFRSVRASQPLEPNTHVYFEFHVSQLAREHSQSFTSDGKQVDVVSEDNDPETVISVGVALQDMPLNVPVGTSLSSIGYQSSGQIVTSSKLVETIASSGPSEASQGYGCGDTVGVLAHVAALSPNQETSKPPVVSVDFFVNGRPVGTKKPVSVPFQSDESDLKSTSTPSTHPSGTPKIYPTLSILSESTFVLGLFSAADLRFPPSASQVREGTTVYALDGSKVTVGLR